MCVCVSVCVIVPVKRIKKQETRSICSQKKKNKNIENRWICAVCALFNGNVRLTHADRKTVFNSINATDGKCMGVCVSGKINNKIFHTF